MDLNSSDLEFFDFKNATEEEIKEIHAILKGPESNGCIELPWEIPMKFIQGKEAPIIHEGITEESEPAPLTKPIKKVTAVVSHDSQFPSPLTPLTPVLPLPPPPVETFATIPTSVGSYPAPPYLVSRTIPYLRAYPHMGVPLFACPIQPESNLYSQYVPVIPEKFAGQIETQPNLNPKIEDRSLNNSRRNKKKGETDSECDPGDRPTSLPIVPLPPSTFAVAGGALPIGYPPGLHTLPYKQLTGPIAPSTAMYYVPFFNHPYGSYLQSPPSAPVMLPINIHREVEVDETLLNKCNKPPDEVPGNVGKPPSLVGNEVPEIVGNPPTFGNEVPENVPEARDKVPDVVSLPSIVQNKVPENTSVASVACEDRINSSEPENLNNKILSKPVFTSTHSERVVETDYNSSSDVVSNSKSISPSANCQTSTENDSSTAEEANTDNSRRWADLFRKPGSEVNGIEHGKVSFKKDITNGKVYPVPAKDSVR